MKNTVILRNSIDLIIMCINIYVIMHYILNSFYIIEHFKYTRTKIKKEKMIS